MLGSGRARAPCPAPHLHLVPPHPKLAGQEGRGACSDTGASGCARAPCRSRCSEGPRGQEMLCHPGHTRGAREQQGGGCSVTAIDRCSRLTGGYPCVPRATVATLLVSHVSGPGVTWQQHDPEHSASGGKCARPDPWSSARGGAGGVRKRSGSVCSPSLVALPALFRISHNVCASQDPIRKLCLKVRVSERLCNERTLFAH